MNQDPEIFKRLKSWRERNNLSHIQAAQRLGVGRAYYTQIENGRVPGRKFIEAFEQIEKLGNIQTASHVQKSTTPEPPQSNVGEPFRVQPGRKVPLIGWAQAGEAIDFSDV